MSGNDPHCEQSGPLRLYFHPASDASRKVLLTAAYLELDLDLQVVDVKRLAHQQPEYLKLNPNGLFPLLIEGDFVLWESSAIMQYLAEKNSDTPLWPSDIRLRADVTRWQCWDLAHWGPALRPFMWEHVGKKIKGLGEPDQAELERALPAQVRLAGVLNDHLANRDWLVGDGLSLADLSVASHLMYRDLARLPLDSYPHIYRWFASVEALPCWRSTRPPIPGTL